MKHKSALSTVIMKPTRSSYRSLSLDSSKNNENSNVSIEFNGNATTGDLRNFPNQGSKILNSNNRKLNSYGATLNEVCGDNDADPHNMPNVSVADIIGSFGWFQFLVLLFSGLREGGVGYDAVVMSIILQPERHFLCADNVSPADREQLAIELAEAKTKSEFINFNDTISQCFHTNPNTDQTLLDPVSGAEIRCKSWIFPRHDPSEGPSLVAEWSLVCYQHWLIAFIESAFFLGLVSGNLIWGFYADRAGRRRAYLIAHTVAVVSGFATIFAPTIELFAIGRFFSAFGSIGYNIIYSIQVEIIGTKHRSFSTTINHLGWGLGVICVPFMDHMFSDYRYIIAVAPAVALIIFPWAFWLPESSRWLMANNQFGRARQELIRAAKFNGKQLSPLIEKRIVLMNEKITTTKQTTVAPATTTASLANNQIAASSGDFSGGAQFIGQSYRLLFKNPILVRDTVILAYISFLGHLFYYMLTINFGYMKHLSVEANFTTSGAVLMAASFGIQALIDSGLAPSLDTELIVTANNGIGTLSSLLLIFIALIVNQEVFPTVIRQTGSSIVNTIGESGSTLAPPAIQLASRIGLWRADLFHAIVCAFAIIGTQFLTKTDDIELADN